MLESVNSPADLRHLSISQLDELAAEIRRLIIDTTARTGGHTAPSLGVVELTIALHRVFDTPRDQLVWDVGHQCYAHKILTGRRDRFATLRQQGGIAGFPKRSESEYDTWDTGHSGDSISVALGLAVGNRLRGDDRRAVAVIGDGSVVAGLAFEALNHAGSSKQDLTVVLNDNEMSIAPSTGAMAMYLNRVITGKMYNRLRADAWNLLGHLPSDLGGKSRLAARKLQEGLKSLLVPSILFEELGFRYLGPVDGHSLPALIETLRSARALPGPVLVHVVTRKGRGYDPAAANPERFHGTGPFDVVTGKACGGGGGRTFTGELGSTLVRLADKDPRVAAITAGMCLGTGLTEFREQFRDRFFDVGICEQHAVAFGAALARAGMRPVVVLYSTFLTRAVDQLVADVALQCAPVVLAVDRAGLVGEDGPTHHGAFDLSYLSMIPGMTVLAPADELELGLMLEYAIGRTDGPVAIRYPRGGSGRCRDSAAPIEHARAEVWRTGKDGCVLAAGVCANAALAAAEALAEQGRLDLGVVNARFVKPLDRELFEGLLARYERVATVEENVLSGGFGEAVERLAEETGSRARVTRIGLPDSFIEHAPRGVLLAEAGLDAAGLGRRFLSIFD
ncbi:MAG: 1-deoxy-D-xylulose-5-phosphate synthase [bacterium]